MSVYIKFLSFVVLATVLVGCSTSNHKGVMGSKGRSSKSFARRHQSREYQEAKVKEKKQVVVLQENQTPDSKEISSPVPTPAAASATNVVTEQKVQYDAATTTAVQTTTNANEMKSGEQTSIINHEIDPAFGLNSTSQSSPLVSLLHNSSADNAFEPRLFPSTTENGFGTKQSAKKRYNKTTAPIISVKAAEQKESKHHWVLYFAFAQAFIALMLGLKQVFGMLDTPSDAGSKAVSMSYATMGILSIHALLLIAVAKSFLS